MAIRKISKENLRGVLTLEELNQISKMGGMASIICKKSGEAMNYYIVTYGEERVSGDLSAELAADEYNID